jgi:chloramphenicol O-acetyltransferase type A
MLSQRQSIPITMKEIVDMNTWIRKDHFKFFNAFEEPFFGVTVDVDCTATYQQAKDLQVSFFLLYLHKSLQAANEIVRRFGSMIR